MTAEIAVMNKTSIALAADSAITIRYGDGEKIYYSINKLFTLSKYRPVGVMIYAAPEFMNVPWETIIKVFRRKLGKTGFDTLQEYAKNFITFLQDESNPLFPESEQGRYFARSIYTYFSLIRDVIDSKVEATIEKEGGISNGGIKSIVSEIIEEHHSTWEEFETLPSAQIDRVQKIISKHQALIKDAQKEVFKGQPISKKSRVALRELCTYLFTKNMFSGLHSGLVIAGFGEQEIFPSLYSYGIEGQIGGHLKYQLADSHQVESGGPVIMSFAQQEMVGTFMDGIDPEYRKAILAYLPTILTKYAESIVEILPQLSKSDRTRLLERLAKVNENLLDAFSSSMTEHETRYHVGPIIFNVGHLPKDELAAMAESLVNITCFKRRVSVEAETAGGPIDVAVISKGDGFIWIKRKHYFQPEKNPQFFANYYRE